jgi:hypothetical protein
MSRDIRHADALGITTMAVIVAVTFVLVLAVIIPLLVRAATDHAEGMCLCSADGWEGPAVLVVCDAASPSRLAHAKGAVAADIFALP